MTSDAAIFERAKVTLTLAGKKYEWVERGRRDSRTILREMFEIIEDIRAGEREPHRLLKAVDDTLDFFFRWHPQIRADQKFVNDNASNDEILEAFWSALEVVNSPFARDRNRSKAEAQSLDNQQTSMPNPESTSS